MLRTIRVSAASLAVITLTMLGGTTAASSSTLYYNGFETDAAGWNVFGPSFDATRVASGTNGVPSASGGFHAESLGGALGATGSAGNWGGYNYGAGGGVPTVFQPYKTSVKIYLDVNAGHTNDTRFDFSSAINDAAGNFLRDFVFNAGFYDSADVAGPGAGTDRFIVSASNNAGRSNSFPKNPGRDPVAIGATGWYTFMHEFYVDGTMLAVDLSILDASNTLINTWTLGGDPIANVGGNRYGWFARNELSTLAFDDTNLMITMVPEPEMLAVFGVGLLGLALMRRRRTA